MSAIHIIIRTVRPSCRAPHAPSALAMASPSASLDCKHNSKRQLNLIHVPTPVRPRALPLGRTLCPSMSWHMRGKHMLEAGKHASQKHAISQSQCCHPVWLPKSRESTWGFCPVISLPSTTTCSVQLSPWQQARINQHPSHQCTMLQGLA